MGDNLPGCVSTDSWENVYAAFKRKIVDTNLLIEKYSVVSQDNSVLSKRVNDLTSLSQSLKSECEKCEKDLQNAVQGQEPLKQCCASLRADLERREQEKAALEGTLASYKATVKQYEDLLKQKQQEAQNTENQGKSSNPRAEVDNKEKISSLEKKVHQGDKKLRQVERKCKRALSVFKALGEKLSKKDALAPCEKRQLKNVIFVLNSLSTEYDREKTGLNGDSSEDDDTAEVKEDNDAEYLEKLLMNGNSAVSSDTDDDLTVVPDSDLANKERAVDGKEAEALCIDCEVGKGENCDKNGEEEEAGCPLSKSQDEKGANDALIKQQDHVPSQPAPSSQASGSSVLGCADEIKEGDTAPKQVASDAIVNAEGDLPRPDNLSKAEGVSGGPCSSDVEPAQQPAVPSEDHLPDSERTAAVETSGGDMGPIAAQRIQSSGMQSKNSPVNCPAKPPPLIINGAKPVAPECARNRDDLSTSAAKKCSEEAGKSRGAESDVESLKAELQKITSEMHFTDLCCIPLSPLPPSPPLFDRDPVVAGEAVYCPSSIPAASTSSVHSEYHDVLPPDMSPNLTSASVKRRMRFTAKKRGKHREESLPFTNMTQDTSSDVTGGKRPFHHQQSEGFEPHVGNSELEEPQQITSSSSRDLSCLYPVVSRKVHTKFWHNPADGTINVRARLPKDSIKKQHLVPTITVEVDPVEYDFHLAYKEVPVASQEAQNPSHYDIWHDSQSERFTVPAESSGGAATVSQSERSHSRHVLDSMPMRPSTMDIHPRSIRGAGHKRPAMIPPVSFACPRSERLCEANIMPLGTSGSTTESARSPPAASPACPALHRPIVAKGNSTGEAQKTSVHTAAKRKCTQKQSATNRQFSHMADDTERKNQEENVDRRKVSFGFNVCGGPSAVAGPESTAADSSQENEFLGSERDQEYELPQRKKRRISLLSTKVPEMPHSIGSKASSKKASTDASPQRDADSIGRFPLTEEDTVAPADNKKDTVSSDLSTAVSENNASGHASVGSDPILAQNVKGSSSSVQDVACPDGIPTDSPSLDDDSDTVPPAKKRRIDCLQLPSEDFLSPSVLSPLSGDTFDFPQQEALRQDPQHKEKRARVPAAPYSIFVTTPKHNFMMTRARGNITLNSTVKHAFDKLAWLATQTHIVPGAVRNVAHTLRSLTDMIAITALSYLANTTANPFLGYIRKETVPPLLTPTEALMLECFEHVEEKRTITEGLFNILLTALRARLFSDRRPKTLLGTTAYCRMIAGICKRMGDIALLRVILWDILRSFCGNAKFLVAAIIGVWPGVLASYRQSSVSAAVILGLRYVLFHAPHTLNKTLSMQTQTICQELGKVEPLDTFQTVSDIAEALINALSTAASSTSDDRQDDEYLLCCLTLEEVCRRSADWQWVVSFVLKKLWLLVSKLMKVEDNTTKGCLHCVITLFGGIWRRFPPEESLLSLKPYVDKVETVLQDKEIGFAVQEAFVQSVLLLPSVDKWESLVSTIMSWQESHKADILQLKPVKRIMAKRRTRAKQKKKFQRRATQSC